MARRRALCLLAPRSRPCWLVARALGLALAVVSAAGSAGCDTTVEVATLDSLEGVELEYEAVGDMVVPRRADGEPLLMVQNGPRAQVVYLNFDGAAIQYGDWRQDNAQTNTSFIVQNGLANLPAFDAGPWGERGQVIGAVVAGLEEDFAGYGVSFTTGRPAGDHTMIMVGGAPEDIGWQGPIGLAPLDAGNWNQSDVGFVFTAEMARYTYDVRHIAWVISHEFGHSFGLQHIAPEDDIMSPVAHHHALRWGEGPTTDVEGYQRDHDVIASVFPASGGPPTPTCGILPGGAALSTNQTLSSCDGRFTLAMQSDGNLVLYMSGVGPLWATATSTGTTAAMQSDGNFVLYDPASTPLFHSATFGNPDAFLALQVDGNLVLYDPASTPLWSSATCCH